MNVGNIAFASSQPLSTGIVSFDSGYISPARRHVAVPDTIARTRLKLTTDQIVAATAIVSQRYCRGCSPARQGA